ncbi:MAG: alanine racemase [Pseudomonadota bacterium]
MPIDSTAIRRSQIDRSFKGYPARAPMALGEIGEQGWRLFDELTPFPVAVIKKTALQSNRAWMKRFADEKGVFFAPHGKTTMAPQLFEMQLDDGAWAMTCATVEQLMVYRQFGVERIFFANQLVGAHHVRYVAEEIERDPNFAFWCLVDTEESVRHLTDHLRQLETEVRLNVLIEVGTYGGRCGIRTADQARATIAALDEARDVLCLTGIEAFEGAVPGDSDTEIDAAVQSLFDRVADIAHLADARRVFETDRVILTAGGTTHFDVAQDRLKQLVLSKPADVVVRAGCYITLDNRFFQAETQRAAERLGPGGATPDQLQPALEVWSYVQSRPEPGLSILSFGKRDVSHDMGLPVPKLRLQPGDTQPTAFPDQVGVIEALNDQHAFFRHSDNLELNVGDLVSVGISHPCTTFDKWRLLYVVDDDYQVCDAIRTYF